MKNNNKDTSAITELQNSIEFLKINLLNIEEPVNFEVTKSAFLDIDLLNFDSLTVYQKISVFLILSDTLIFNCLISIIFIFYGDYLIKKYDLENKCPRLAKLINLILKNLNN